MSNPTESGRPRSDGPAAPRSTGAASSAPSGHPEPAEAATRPDLAEIAAASGAEFGIVIGGSPDKIEAARPGANRTKDGASSGAGNASAAGRARADGGILGLDDGDATDASEGMVGQVLGHDAPNDAEVDASADESPEPVWLTEQQRRAWVALAGIVIRLPGMLDAQLGRESGLSFFEYMVLAALSEVPARRLRMTELASVTSGSLSRLSHVAKRLEQGGYITREADAADRRVTNAVLTDQGEAKLGESAPGHVGFVRDLIFGALSEEQTHELADAMTAIMSRVDPEGALRPFDQRDHD